MNIKTYLSEFLNLFKNNSRSNVEIRYALLNEDSFPPVRKHEDDAGMDVYSDKDSVIPPHSFGIVSTGVSVKVPQGCMLDARPKSKSNFLLGAGVIDYGYQGEILIKIVNITAEPLIIHRGDPIAQLVASQIVVGKLVQHGKEALFSQSSKRGGDGGIVKEISSHK
jgi:dUTP pyrophosphatase